MTFLKILDEKNKLLHEVCEEVTFPLDKEYIKLAKEMAEYLENSQDEIVSEKYNLRPGMGLAAPQLGIKKRFIAIVDEETDEKDRHYFTHYLVFNPKIISHSEELIYTGAGEGCLSVNREVEGLVPRFARVRISGYNEKGQEIIVRAREDLSIAFQHEIDHLDGILFVDRIDKKIPYKNSDKIRMI